jgi:hypothetical protein
MDFPRTVYKSPGKIRYNKDKSYDAIIVKDLDEYNMCLDEGYSGVFAEAFEEKEIVISEKTDWNKLAKLAGITGEDLKKFKKKGSVSKQKYLDNLKG